ncbi:extracellular exo-alpha-L-arabinofuranosidase [Abditibacteriota bacterium]|nr:extracellular exo-alpha-L-arabinofuranosidase [Abditibacteriota bacterium]
MKRIYPALGVVAVGLVLCAPPLLAQNARISVNTQNVVNHISPWLAGSCIEDVNHEIYGGLYDQKIFGESFEEPSPNAGIQDWKTYGGDWRLEGQVISVGADSGGKLVSDSPAFSDGNIETEVRFPNGTGDNAGLLVRVNNAGLGADTFDGYEISLEPRGQRVILGKHHHDWQPLQNAQVTFDPQKWTRLRVELSGARIRIFVGDSATPQIDFTDPTAPLLMGTVALRTWNSNASFQNVRGPENNTAPERFVAEPVIQVSRQWDAIHEGTGTAQFLHDRVNPYNGTWSQMIQHGTGQGTVGVANKGLNRWGVAVKRQRPLGGRLYLRAQDLQGPVTVALQSANGQITYATQTIAKVGTDWAKYTLSLTPNADDANARFVITLDKPGSLWVDQVVLSGTGNAQFKGLPIRADIARAMQEQGIKFLRYGGTMVNAPEYRWKNMIGDPDRRPPYRGHWYPYSTNGFGIEEFLRFCEAANIEAAFAINVEESEQDVADLVEYLNSNVNTVWGKRRAQNGHPAPYKVRWIEIGNEEVIWGDNAGDYDHYIARFNALSTVIHAKDPGIQLVCSAWWRPESPNMERVFKALDGKAAFWDLHVWSDEARSGASVDRDLTQMQSLFRQWGPNSQMKCVIFEENGGLHNQQRALGHATTLNAVRRHGDFVVVSCPANALQPDGQNDNGWDQGQIFFSPDRVWKMPPFYAAQMAALNFQPLRVQSTVEGNLDATATRSEDGKSLVLHVVNTSDTAQTATLSLDGMAGISPQAQVWTLAGDLKAANSPDHETVATQRSQFAGASAKFNYSFAAHSYTILRLAK